MVIQAEPELRIPHAPVATTRLRPARRYTGQPFLHAPSVVCIGAPPASPGEAAYVVRAATKTR